MKIVREPTRVIASVFGLCGFLVALLAGLRAGASTTSTLLTAIVALLACRGLGLFAGWCGERAVADFLESYREARPVPDVKAAERALLRGERSKAGSSPVDRPVNNSAA